MKLNIIYKNARCAVAECIDGSIFQLGKTYDVYVNGEKVQETDRVIFSLYGLKPETMYTVEVREGEKTAAQAVFTTDYEFVTLNVKDFGAKGDGVSNDTHYIQAAIMACPKDSRVLIPEGTYKITSLFLKDDVKSELEKGAVLEA